MVISNVLGRMRQLYALALLALIGTALALPVMEEEFETPDDV